MDANHIKTVLKLHYVWMHLKEQGSNFHFCQKTLWETRQLSEKLTTEIKTPQLHTQIL